MEIICKYCSKTFEGRKDALYCSDACRKAYKRSTGLPESDLQPQLEQLRDDLAACQYKASVVRDMINEFLKDHPHLVATITDEYFGRIIKRRYSQGETQQLEKYFGYRPDPGQKMDK